MPDDAIDSITLEIVHNALGAMVDDTFLALMKSAYSQNIKERRDHSTAFADVSGRLVVQARDSLPIHLGSMLGLMQTVLAKIPLAQMRKGDIFAANDPFEAGGTHLPDLNLAMPVFDGGAVIGFVCNIAHHADFGGMTPGSMGGGMREIYQEGLRVPLVRLFSAGQLCQDIYDMILINTRVPEERRGDLNAQIAAAKLGARRMEDLVDQYGGRLLSQAFDEIILRTEKRMRHGIAGIPDGVYRFADVMDDDGCGNEALAIAVRVTIAGDRFHVDFEGSAGQTAGNINCTPSATLSAISYTLKAMLDPEIANNQGVLDVCEWSAHEGSIVNAVFPASVANRAHTCQRIIDALIGALAEAMPDRVVAAGNGANTTAVFTGIHPDTGRRYIYFETLGGGAGARATRDGKDGVQVHITNTSNLPVEAIEMDYPLRVVEYGLVEDSGGAGHYRGGLGLRRTLRPVGHVCTFSGSGERNRTRPWGLFGGAPGSCGTFSRRDRDGALSELPSKPAGVEFGPEAMITIETPGAGGYGPPRERDRAAIEEDRRSGKYSAGYLAAHYGREAS